MVLTEEIKIAAQALGQSLRQDDFLQAYLEAIEECRTDPEARELEGQLYTLYNALIGRQQAGEHLSSEETQEFHRLRRRVQSHPLIFKRDNELMLIKPYLASIADEISAVLKVDYTTLARSE